MKAILFLFLGSETAFATTGGGEPSEVILWITGFIFFLLVVLLILLVRSHRELADLKKKLPLLPSLDQKMDQDAFTRSYGTFLKSISHDIRTPLNSVVGYADLILDFARDDHDEQLAHDAKKILSSGQELIFLVNNLLYFTQVAHGYQSQKFLPFAIGDALTSVIPILKERAKDKGLAFHFKVEPLPKFVSDPDKIVHLVVNLVDNAIKFTKVGSITVEVGAFVHDPSYCLITIVDTGISIPPERQSQIFRLLNRPAKDISHSGHGSGLGLAIVSHILHQIEGRIQFETDPKKGTRFEVCLPFKPTATTALAS